MLCAGHSRRRRFHHADNGLYTVNVLISDGDGGQTNCSTVVSVNNVAPAISSVNDNGPVNEASSAQVTVVASDPAGAADALTYYFDFDNDLTYEVSGPSPVASRVYDDNGIYVVNVKVTDGDGGEVTSSTSVTVNNVAPTLAIAGALTATAGQPVNFTFTATDPSTADQAGLFSYSIDWDGNGSIDQTLTGGSQIQIAHAYSVGGGYTVRATVTDKDAGQSVPALHIILIGSIVTAVDECDPSRKMLVGNDNIHITSRRLTKSLGSLAMRSLRM